MRPEENDIIEFKDAYGRNKRRWLYAFACYAAVEALYITINYTTTYSKCTVCVLPVPYYILQWLTNLLLTGLLWNCLNLTYRWRLWKIIAGNIFIFLVYYFLWAGMEYFILNSKIDWLVGAEMKSKPVSYVIYNSWFDIGKYVLKLSAFYLLKFYFEYRKAAGHRIQLAIINKDMQLNLLKQQLSPHFYFNTLNNLYGLSRSNSPRLSGALSQLSNIMQYVIVDCNQPKVLLRQEVNFLRSYIELEKLRYEKDTTIEIKTEGHVNGQTIIPLLLIQFVENAFKHGMKEKSDRSWMKVSMDIDGKDLFFKVENSYYEKASSHGIGINSVKHILDLQYEGRYTIQMKHEENSFSVTLKLNLS